jgi:glutamate-1-semialdehyde 2,1-aminomutase
MTARSAELYREAVTLLPGGVSRNTLLRDPHPIYVDHGRGCRVVDVDGREFVDFGNNMASLIHGHAHPAIVEAVARQLARGTAFNLATEAEIRMARTLCARSPGFERVRFVNSGTEAVMAMLKAARAYTGRPRIAKVEGTYHGAYDYAEVSQAPDPAHWGDRDRPRSVPLAHGTPEGVLRDVTVLPFNDPERALAILDEDPDTYACVLIDPMPHRVGLVPASEAFVEALHAWTRRHGALLVFDEVVTFRAEVGGMQQRMGVCPDLTAMGKLIGGGFPVGAVAGRADVMNVFAPRPGGAALPHSGTFSANPLTMTAGRVALERFDAEAVARLNALGRLARSRIEEAIAVAGVPAAVTGRASMFRIHLKPEAPTDYRSTWVDAGEAKRLHAFLDAVFDAGILLLATGTGMLSTPMTGAEIDRLADAVVGGLRKIRGPLETAAGSD